MDGIAGSAHAQIGVALPLALIQIKLIVHTRYSEQKTTGNSGASETPQETFQLATTSRCYDSATICAAKNQHIH